jgi:putative transposase
VGALKNVGYQVGRGTIANILLRHGVDPAPLRGKRTAWSTFLKAHWKILVASDFFSVEVWRLQGLTTYYVIFFIELATRKVVIGGITLKSQRRVDEASRSQSSRCGDWLTAWIAPAACGS